MAESFELQQIPENPEQNSEFVVESGEQNNISIDYEPKEEAEKIRKRNLILVVVLSSILALGFAIFGVLWYNFPPTATDSNILRNELRQESHEQGRFKV